MTTTDPDPMAVLRSLGVGALAERMGLEVSELATDLIVDSLKPPPTP